MEEIEITKFAPIIIPTLNRYEHLKRCIDSLARNTWADRTELYISLDYPPESKYVDGYYKVKEYLERGIEGFKDVHIFFQEDNLGAYLNGDFLYRVIKDSGIDTLIFTEDDNEFSPCFLDYINKGLKFFEKDEKIVMLSGYKRDDEVVIGSIGKSLVYRPWGYGTWIRKTDALQCKISKAKYKEYIDNSFVCRNLFINSPDSLRDIFEGFLGGVDDISGESLGLLLPNGEVAYTERSYRSIMAIEGKWGIIPAVNMVRNWGFDGSGTVVIDDVHSKQCLSSARYYEFVNTEMIDEVKSDIPPKIDWMAKRAKVLIPIYRMLGYKITRGIMNFDFRVRHNWWRLRHGMHK